MGLIQLNLKFLRPAFPCSSKGSCISLPFPASRSYLHSLAVTSNFKASSPTSSNLSQFCLSFFPSFTCKDSCDYSGPTLLIQDELFISRQLISKLNYFCKLLSSHVTQYVAASEEQDVDIFGGGRERSYCASHQRNITVVWGKEAAERKGRL